MAACPTGIDIRDGQQLECITCALCIDACDRVMDKVGRPRGLISYSTLRDFEHHTRTATTKGRDVARAEQKRVSVSHVARPRTILYFSLWALIGVGMLAVLATRGALEGRTTGWALAAAGALLGLRLLRWQGWRTWREPIVAVLHLGYLWLAASLALLGLAALLPDRLPASSALHALTAGAVGTMTLAVMTRASLGHTGREIRADAWTVAIYILVSLGAILRVAAGLAPEHYFELLVAGGAFWSGGFLLFALRYAPILWGARAGR